LDAAINPGIDNPTSSTLAAITFTRILGPRHSSQLKAGVGAER